MSSLTISAAQAFESKFLNTNQNVESFLKHVRLCRAQWLGRAGGKVLYSPYFAVVQSSMMGKTRLFYELPKFSEEFVVYMCLRRPTEDGFPVPFPLLFNALVSSEPSQRFYLSFLFTVILQLKNFLKGGITNQEWFRLQTLCDGTFWDSITGKIICVCYS